MMIFLSWIGSKISATAVKWAAIVSAVGFALWKFREAILDKGKIKNLEDENRALKSRKEIDDHVSEMSADDVDRALAKWKRVRDDAKP